MNEVFRKLEYKAECYNLKYRQECEKIEALLSKKFPEEAEYIDDVIYQSGDGIVVVYKQILNIPLTDFLTGKRF